MSERQSNPRPFAQIPLLLEFFKRNPNRDIKHPEIVDWVTEEYKKRTGKVFRDPDRGIRHLHQIGYLIKVAKGVYRYAPELHKQRQLEDFSPTLRQASRLVYGDFRSFAISHPNSRRQNYSLLPSLMAQTLHEDKRTTVRH